VVLDGMAYPELRLVITLVLLIAYSMSKEKGKNIKFARKDVKPLPRKLEKHDLLDTSDVIEVN
jgi:hypothetical protein